MENRWTSALVSLPVAVVLAASCQAESITVGNVSFVRQRLEAGVGEKAFASGDFNNDGHQDLIVTDRSRNDLVVFLGNGAGALREASRCPAGENPAHVAVGDIDADGEADIVVANHETSHLTLLLGDGRGAFEAAPDSPLTIDVSPHPHVVHVQDLDADGHPELVVDNREAGGLLVLKGLGKGSFATPGAVVDMGGDPYRGMVTGDIDGDGRPDLVTPNPDEIAIALNTTAERLEFDLAAPIQAPRPFAVALADMDADGLFDLVVASAGTDAIEIHHGDGRGGFTKPTSLQRLAAGAKSIAIGDIDGDGIDDALVVGWSSGALVVVGATGPYSTVGIELGSTENPWGLAIVDLNEDGADDFVIGDGVRPFAQIYLSSKAGRK